MKLYIKKPGKDRASYAIYKREVLKNGKTKNVTIENEDLDNVNLRLKDIPGDIAYKNVLAIKKSLEQKLGIDKGVVVHNLDNHRILEDYWQKKYRRRDLVDSRSARFRFERAIRAIGNVSLLTGTADQIEDAIADCRDHKNDPITNNAKRVHFGKIKLLLKFLGRDLELRVPKEDHVSVSYMSEADFLKKLKTLEDKHLYHLFYVLFYTGMRLGESFALTDLKLRPDARIVHIDSQFKPSGKINLTKNRKNRTSFVISKAFPIIRKWIALKDTFPYSRTNANRLFKKHFGQEFTIHDLRHCYAIMYLAKGVPLAHVSQSIGNSVKVCEKYYTGFELVDESVQLMRRIVGD
ncbi:MAG: hypothetical protein NVS1B10_07770 [Candidatus Saccharimonadales bacterium]